MDSFFELISKIPQSLYETEKGVSPVPINNLVANGRCSQTFPSLNSVGLHDPKLNAEIVTVVLQEEAGNVLQLRRNATDPATTAAFSLGNNSGLNNLLPGETYTFALDVYVPDTITTGADIALQIGDAVEDVWEWSQTALSATGFSVNSWLRFHCTRTLRESATKTELRIILNDQFAENDTAYVRYAQLENREFPSLFADQGGWHASWSASNIAKLFNLYSSVFDELQTVISDMSLMRSLDIVDNQKGQILDEIGKILKEPRYGRNDYEYRIILNTAIARKVSSGSLPTVVETTKLLANGAGFTITELYTADDCSTLNGEYLLTGWRLLSPYTHEPAAIAIDFTGDTSGIDKDYYKKVIKEIISAGVDVEIDEPNDHIN